MTNIVEPVSAPVEGDDGLAAVRSNDRAATERFVRSHAGWMNRVACRVLRHDDLAEDVVQNAFVNIFRNLHRFEGRSSVKTWMHRIVVNEALMALRKLRRTGPKEVDELLPVFDDAGCRVEDDSVTFVTPETLIETARTKALVSQQIDRLPDKYRAVLLLRDIEEMSTAEVAETLGLSEGNVKVRLHRARAALKKLLEPLIGENEL